MELLADFHVEEPSTMVYSAPPSMTYPPPDQCLEFMDNMKKSPATDKQKASFIASFKANLPLFDMRYCPEGVSSQNLSGAAKNLPTSQDDRHITDKVSAEWQKSRDVLTSEADHMSAMAFLMDGALAFAPLVSSPFVCACACCMIRDPLLNM
jgi:hypothetical protein